MKNHTAFLFFFFSVFLVSPIQSQDFAPGYYISNTNDTINTQIKLPHYALSNKVMLLKFAEKVEIKDSSKGNRTFKVNDIKGFGFLLDNQQYHYLSKDFGKENAFSASTHKFYQALLIGPKCNLFHRMTTVGMNETIMGIMYFLEGSNGTSTALYFYPRTQPDFVKNLLKNFFKEQQELYPLIDASFQSSDITKWHKEVLEIVATVNKM